MFWLSDYSVAQRTNPFEISRRPGLKFSSAVTIEAGQPKQSEVVTTVHISPVPQKSIRGLRLGHRVSSAAVMRIPIFLWCGGGLVSDWGAANNLHPSNTGPSPHVGFRSAAFNGFVRKPRPHRSCRKEIRVPS